MTLPARRVFALLLCCLFCAAPALAYRYTGTAVKSPCSGASGVDWGHSQGGGFHVCDGNSNNYDVAVIGSDNVVLETPSMRVTFDFGLADIPGSAVVTELMPEVRAKVLHSDRTHAEWSSLKVILGSSANGQSFAI